MKFQIGDKVVVLHSNEEGEVIDIINNKMVMVEVRGVKFPAYTDQLDFPYFKWFTEKKVVPEKKAPKKFIEDIPREKKKVSEKVADGIWLTFIPVMHADDFGDDVVDDLKIHLINRTHSGYKFKYTLQYAGEPEFELNNTVHPFEDFYLHDIPFENLNDSPNFSFEFSLITPDKNRADYYEAGLKLKAKQVFARIEELKQKGEATFSYRLFENYPARVENVVDVSPLISKGYKVYDAAHARQHLEPAKAEIDLHIEKLALEPEKMDNFEMLTLQLKTFEKYLELAIAHHRPSLVAIHGLGSGKLRDEIHEILRLRKEVRTFVNQYHSAYGYGATEIYFQY
ncbi:MAG: hypothetical protein P0Y53_16055 [Candidatus Pseudobacter hemicellulosilyticus]|uniref:Smr domain-containing protein n=1 Tax=Candidatus Pseudobacter hemicellulosilyticus TaxID=3121375 RepID=A0AAJ5WNS4_9BACT|nr:MAG: hypothetical protein P0Y53_16055 [Pseudobacter sp.]